MSSPQVDRDELRERVDFINRCKELKQVAESARNNLKHERADVAKADLTDLRARTDSTIEDLEEYLDRQEDSA